MESPKVQPGLMSLPRELRDEIYSCLLSGTHRLHFPELVTYPSFYIPALCAKDVRDRGIRNRGGHNPIISHWTGLVLRDYISHPKLVEETRPSTDTVVPWRDRSVDKESLEQHNLNWKFQNERRLLKQSVERLAILRTSRQVFEEASPMLFPRCTFLFSITAPIYHPISVHEVICARAQNIDIHVDLIKAFSRERLADVEYDSFMLLAPLLRLLADDPGVRRKRITIEISYPEDNAVLLEDYLFAAALRDLTSCDTVVLKMAHVYKYSSYRGWDEGRLETKTLTKSVWERRVRWVDEKTRRVYRALDKDVRDRLGPAVYEEDGRDWYWLVYHPFHHVYGGERPKLRIEEL